MKKKDDFVKILLMFDQMSKDLSIGRLTNSEKDILLKLHNELANKEKKLVDIRLIKFKDYFGKPIPRSTVYKSLKSLLKKRLIKHIGSVRSSLYSI